ncbi:MAG: nucleotidyltransferase family protein [Propionibacteriaceae bacterium]|nr:nucleotidyltransferase family protein [Propionibacteriaceae bacterium]
MATNKAIVMARGLGSRMKKDADASLTPDQAAAAASGAKAMMPLGGRPFLDHSLSRLADAGLTEVCLVIGPEHTGVRDYYDSLDLERIEIFYAVQEEPRGTADAVAAAGWFAGSDQVVVINGDNLYPTEALATLARTDGSATVGFTPAGLVAGSNIPADRMTAFATITPDADGALAEIVEKPTPEQLEEFGPDRLISMNCWLFTPAIFDACARIEESARGELEIVDAVRLLVAEGERFAIVPSGDGVLDLSSRGDIASVAALLEDAEVKL